MIVRPSSVLKRRVLKAITLLTAVVAGLLLLVCAAIWESARLGPYTSWFNNRMLAKAERAHLVGSSVDRVQDVLGPADNIMRFRDASDVDGRSAGHARFVTTYEYYPYPWLPFSKFQVHTTEGVVRSLERFDD